MPRPTIPLEQRKQEGAKLEAVLSRAQKNDESLTQESLAMEMEVTQGLINQWLKGRSPIPDKRLLWLSKRLLFNPIEVRTSFAEPKIDAITTSKEKRILEAYRNDPDLRRSIDAIAEMSAFYRAAEKQK